MINYLLFFYSIKLNEQINSLIESIPSGKEFIKYIRNRFWKINCEILDSNHIVLTIINN